MTTSTRVDYSKRNFRSSPASDEEVVFEDFTELSLEVEDGGDDDDDDDELPLRWRMVIM